MIEGQRYDETGAARTDASPWLVSELEEPYGPLRKPRERARDLHERDLKGSLGRVPLRVRWRGNI